MRSSLPLLVLSLAIACKTESSTPSAEKPAAPATGAPGSAAPGGNPHAGMDPATRALQPRTTEPRTLQKLPNGRVVLGPFTAQVPEGWTEKPSVSGMRAAEFQVPDSGGQAEVVVYYFGQSGAGGVQANIDRWIGQFTQPDGKPSKDVAKLEQATFAGQEAHLVTVSGNYASRPTPGSPEAVNKPDQTLQAAIVPSPSGPYYFRLLGDRAAVEAQAGKFRELLSSLQLDAPGGGAAAEANAPSHPTVAEPATAQPGSTAQPAEAEKAAEPTKAH